VLRGCLLAGMSATLAVVAHLVGGGAPPDTGLTVLLTIGVAAAGVAMANRRRGRLAILTGLGVSHLGLHLILSVTSMGMPGAAGLDGWPMLGAHVLAVLIAAAILSGAESAIFTVAAAVGMLLPRRLSPPPVPEAPSRCPIVGHRPQDRPLEVLLRRACARRGPPMFAV
jgi:hypothetical protein